MGHFGTVSAVGGGLALVTALLLHFPLGGKLPRARIVLVMAGAAGLAIGTVGGLLHRAITFLYNLTSSTSAHWIGVGGIVVGLLIGGYVTVHALRDLWAGQADGKTLAAAALTPATVSLIPGPAGAVAMYIVGGIAWGVGQFMYYLYESGKGLFS